MKREFSFSLKIREMKLRRSSTQEHVMTEIPFITVLPKEYEHKYPQYKNKLMVLLSSDNSFGFTNCFDINNTYGCDSNRRIQRIKLLRKNYIIFTALNDKIAADFRKINELETLTYSESALDDFNSISMICIPKDPETIGRLFPPMSNDEILNMGKIIPNVAKENDKRILGADDFHLIKHIYERESKNYWRDHVQKTRGILKHKNKIKAIGDKLRDFYGESKVYYNDHLNDHKFKGLWNGKIKSEKNLFNYIINYGNTEIRNGRQSHKIYGVWIGYIFDWNKNNEIILTDLILERNLFTEVEYKFVYVHSHVPPGNGFIFKNMCMGTSLTSSFIGTNDFSKMTDDEWDEFLLSVDHLIEYEDRSNPFILMRSVSYMTSKKYRTTRLSSTEVNDMQYGRPRPVTNNSTRMIRMASERKSLKVENVCTQTFHPVVSIDEERLLSQSRVTPYANNIFWALSGDDKYEYMGYEKVRERCYSAGMKQSKNHIVSKHIKHHDYNKIMIDGREVKLKIIIPPNQELDMIKNTQVVVNDDFKKEVNKKTSETLISYLYEKEEQQQQQQAAQE